jgi:ferredoxin
MIALSFPPAGIIVFLPFQRGSLQLHKGELPMAKNVTIDKDECIGCQSCVEICPDVFGFDDGEEKAYVLENFDENADCAEEAQASCPADCITIG